MAWLGDHWGTQQYRVPYFSSNEAAFQLGFIVIAIFFAVLLIKQVWVYRKILWLRRKYPLKQLNREFYLVNFQGYLYLFDENAKQRLHVKNQSTALDLGFINEWEYFEISRDASNDEEITLRNRKVLKLSNYPENSLGIHTQGVTGT